MQPQGSGAVNTAYLDNITAQINAIENVPCEVLQSLANTVAADIEAQLTAIRAQISSLTAIVTIPGANLGAIVGWITSFVAPYEIALATYEAQLSQILGAVAALESAIANAAARLTSCTITVPPIT